MNISASRGLEHRPVFDQKRDRSAGLPAGSRRREQAGAAFLAVGDSPGPTMQAVSAGGRCRRHPSSNRQGVLPRRWAFRTRCRRESGRGAGEGRGVCSRGRAAGAARISRLCPRPGRGCSAQLGFGTGVTPLWRVRTSERRRAVGTAAQAADGANAHARVRSSCGARVTPAFYGIRAEVSRRAGAGSIEPNSRREQDSSWSSAAGSVPSGSSALQDWPGRRGPLATARDQEPVHATRRQLLGLVVSCRRCVVCCESWVCV